MPKWVNLPQVELKYHPYQDAFWKARRKRLCYTCKIEYSCPPDSVCPQCKKIGVRANHRLLLLSGRRGGKTEAGAIAAVEEACVPNTIGWCCAPTNPKLHRYILPALQRLIPANWVKNYSAEYGDIQLINGSLIHLQTLEDPDQGRGQGLDWVWIDEICELTDMHWHVLRPSLTEKRGVAFFTSSPRSFDWVYENFYVKAEEEEPGYWAARYATIENPAIDAAEIAEAKATMPETMFRQEYLADFVTFTGAVYGGLIEGQILHNPVEVRNIIPEWPNIDSWRQILVGIDTGADHPFGAVKAISTERGIVVVGEYLERHKTFIQHSNAIKAMVGNGNIRWAINKNERQPMLELAQHGIYCQGAENDVVAGTERVKSWLHNRQLWFVESLCPLTIKQMKAYRWAEDKTKDGQVRKEKVYKLNDELPDCVRYFCMAWPSLPKAPPELEAKPRDISGFSPEIQASIMRMRRLDPDPMKKEQQVVTGIGDFFC
jgi:hypothetical protein